MTSKPRRVVVAVDGPLPTSTSPPTPPSPSPYSTSSPLLPSLPGSIPNLYFHVPIKTQVAIGNPKEMICDAVENLNADLFLMGSHAFGPIKRMFCGGDNAIIVLARLITIMHGLTGCSWGVSAITAQTMHGTLSSSLREKGITDMLDKVWACSTTQI